MSHLNLLLSISCRLLPTSLLLTVFPLARSAPGMTSWVCGSCANPNVLFSAEARILSPDGGEVGTLRLLQSLPRDQGTADSAGPVMIDVSLNIKTFTLWLTASLRLLITEYDWRG